LFTQLFKRPKAVERYRTAPLAESRLSYLRHCAEEGAAQHTLRKIAAYQLIFVNCLDLVAVKEVRPEQIEDAADRWISRQPAYHSQKDARASRVVFITIGCASWGGCTRPQPLPNRTHSSSRNSRGIWDRSEAFRR